jgi:hypothetical protein
VTEMMSDRDIIHHKIQWTANKGYSIIPRHSMRVQLVGGGVVQRSHL